MGVIILGVVLIVLKIIKIFLKDYCIVVFGLGFVGIGNVDWIYSVMVFEGFLEEEVYNRFWVYDYRGLLMEEINDLVLF